MSFRKANLKRTALEAAARFPMRPRAIMHPIGNDWRAVVMESYHPNAESVARCTHRHRSRRTALQCAERMLRRVARQKAKEDTTP